MRAISGMWKRSHGRTSEAPPDERGGYRYVRPTATASHLDSTLDRSSRRSLRVVSRPCAIASRCGPATLTSQPQNAALSVSGTTPRFLATPLLRRPVFPVLQGHPGGARSVHGQGGEHLTELLKHFGAVALAGKFAVEAAIERPPDCWGAGPGPPGERFASRAGARRREEGSAARTTLSATGP